MIEYVVTNLRLFPSILNSNFYITAEQWPLRRIDRWVCPNLFFGRAWCHFSFGDSPTGVGECEKTKVTHLDFHTRRHHTTHDLKDVHERRITETKTITRN